MFNQTWKWAGEARRSDKKLGVRWYEIPVHLNQMLATFASRSSTTLTHPPRSPLATITDSLPFMYFRMGNGRHARLMADLLLMQLEGRRFEWGRESLTACERTSRTFTSRHYERLTLATASRF